jgi:hypothetical protein
MIVPCLRDSIENIRYQQAKKIAKKHVEYLKGTMNLEGQQPDPRFIDDLLKDEESYLLQNPKVNLWEE